MPATPRSSLARILLVAVVLCAAFVPPGCTRPPEVKVVGVATLMSHPALDALQKGMVDEMVSAGFVEGQTVRYVRRNANGQAQLAATIAGELAAQQLDAVVAITTPMAQAAAKVTRIPLVFGAVTDPVGAGILDAIDRPKPLITGTSDAWPYEAQLRLIQAITPGVRRLGFIFNPGEAAADYGIRELRRLAPALGFELVEGPVSSTNDVYPVAEQLAPRSDALFVGSDNTAISGVAAALKVAVARRMPLYVGDSGTVERGGLAAVSVGYEALGHETGKLLARMLRGERNIPAVAATGEDIYINAKAAEMMGVTIPPEVLKRATKVYTNVAQ